MRVRTWGDVDRNDEPQADAPLLDRAWRAGCPRGRAGRRHHESGRRIDAGLSGERGRARPPRHGRRGRWLRCRRSSEEACKLADAPARVGCVSTGLGMGGRRGRRGACGPQRRIEQLEPRRDMPRLLRRIYAAAVGGSEQDWTELDRVMAVERHTAVLVRPARIYANPGESHAP